MEERQANAAEDWHGAMTSLYADFRAYCEAALRRGDEEDIHQARVAGRKLMTLLKVLDREDDSGLHPLIKAAGKRLGRVRDLDVQTDAFRKRRKAARKADNRKEAKLLKSVVKRLRKRRGKRMARLADRLPPLLGSGLEEKWKDFLANGLPAAAGRADAGKELARLTDVFELRRLQFEQLRQKDGNHAAESLDALHKLRIAAKELRYLTAAAGFALDDGQLARLARFKALQQRLGVINDLRVRLDMLKKLGGKRLKRKRGTLRRLREAMERELAASLAQLELHSI